MALCALIDDASMERGWTQQGVQACCCVSPGCFAASSSTSAPGLPTLLLGVAFVFRCESLAVEKPGCGWAQLRRSRRRAACGPGDTERLRPPASRRRPASRRLIMAPLGDHQSTNKESFFMGHPGSAGADRICAQRGSASVVFRCHRARATAPVTASTCRLRKLSQTKSWALQADASTLGLLASHLLTSSWAPRWHLFGARSDPKTGAPVTERRHA